MVLLPTLGMKKRDFFLILFLSACLVLAAGCSQAGTGGTGEVLPGTTPAPVHMVSDGNLTPRDVVLFVDKAVMYAKTNGKEKALAAFNNPNGEFSKDGMFVFAIGSNGTALAEPFQPELNGKNLNDLTDPYGVPVVRNLAETARFGKGYVSYDYPNPAKNNTVEPKLTVVSDVDGSYYVAAGMYESSGMIYPSTLLGPVTRNNTREELVGFVKNAVAFARENGREKTLAAFNDRNGSFADGQMTIMALDYNGTPLASSLSPEIAMGRINLINYHDPDGVATIREMRDLSRDGGGVSYTVAKGTSNGKVILIPKLDYAEPIDDTWWLFAGITAPGFEPLVAGNITGVMVRNHTRAEAYDLVNRAVTYAKENGKEKTIQEINHGRFANGDLFVWAESFDGTILADPYWGDSVGKNMMNYTDLSGQKTTVVGLSALRNGTGFTHAMFPDTSGSSTVPVPKLLSMKAVDDTWWIGSGIYGVDVR
jgi:signal transduction histidine kinase